MEVANNVSNVGIYEIKCLATNKIYIGSSISIKKRIKDHVYSLKGNRHCNTILQNAWNKYGENTFIATCIVNLNEDISEEGLLEIEQKYLDKIRPWNRDIGFNINNIANKPPKYSKDRPRRFRDHSGKNNYMYGKKHTEEALAKMRGPDPSITWNKNRSLKEKTGNLNYVSPNVKQIPITLKNISGEIKTLLRYEWVKENVQIKLIFNKDNKPRTSKGWFSCPACCLNTDTNCLCKQIIDRHLQYKKNPKEDKQYTLIQKSGTTKTLTRQQWLIEEDVNIEYLYRLKNDPTRFLNGWKRII